MNTELHPFAPFMPEGARVLIMGTFPPGKHRWCMDFYYPNPTNDFWRICGLLFFGDKNRLYDAESKRFKEEECKKLMAEKHIALHDTAHEIRRLKGNASDKYLEIVTPTPIYDLLRELPDCRTIATTGEKAAGIVAELTGTPLPRIGEKETSADGLEIWRMPSTSRAYPLSLEKKAEYYRRLFHSVGII